jgi:hypothetical protein
VRFTAVFVVEEEQMPRLCLFKGFDAEVGGWGSLKVGRRNMAEYSSM